ncbi:ATP-binding cassette domain-containing protein [Sphingomonas arenae]|uniref:ATP-binding cassette domain-containing protein n=1 Tax=Sphingomonas arenae TaxID=2812555 RepID=UPI00196886A8|nr:ATP-binding cassette domain-containing protein [Sphingomonas arenae]
MWGFVNCTRYYQSFGAPKVVLHEANLAVRTDERFGLLVRAGEGKSTIVRLLAGVDRPDEGHVLRDEGGWPLGYPGAFQAQLTGEENIVNIAEMVGLEPLSYSAFCADFSELGEAYFSPLTLYTGRMRAQLAFAASFGMPATTYLADEKLVAGDDAFKRKCASALKSRLDRAGLILVASNPKATKDFCDRHAVLVNGKIILCGDHDEAAELFAASASDPQSDDVGEDELASFDLA